MRAWYRITYLYDVSPSALSHCSARIPYAHQTTRDARELCASENVDIVFVINADEFHAGHAICALEHDKFAFVEKPVALTRRDVLAIGEAERKSRGSVMVGYMRRYAAGFEEAVREVGGMGEVLYARVRG